MSLEDRERGMLRLVAEQRDEACRRLLAEAEQAAREILRQTHRKERAHLHRRILEERARIQARIQAVEAERVTRERRQQARSSAGILEQAWPLLQLGLAQRWQDADGRRRWVGRSVRQALGALPAGAWTLRHAPGWPAAEQQAVREQLTRELGVEPQLRSDSTIEAGVIIDSGGACLDASLRGLLADRQRLEARLLALLAGESRP
jgi:hypothetical protein